MESTVQYTHIIGSIISEIRSHNFLLLRMIWIQDLNSSSVFFLSTYCSQRAGRIASTFPESGPPVGRLGELPQRHCWRSGSAKWAEELGAVSGGATLHTGTFLSLQMMFCLWWSNILITLYGTINWFWNNISSGWRCWKITCSSARQSTPLLHCCPALQTGVTPHSCHTRIGLSSVSEEFHCSHYRDTTTG